MSFADWKKRSNLYQTFKDRAERFGIGYDEVARAANGAGEVALLERMHDAWAGLKACGWREIEYCPKDGSRFLAISAGSTGVFPHYYSGEWPDGRWWAEAHGDLWPARPILWKPMPSNVRRKGRPACGTSP